MRNQMVANICDANERKISNRRRFLKSSRREKFWPKIGENFGPKIKGSERPVRQPGKSVTPSLDFVTEFEPVRH
jgi:hypothetical protein